MRTSGAHVRKTCARSRKCARRAPSAPLISNTDYNYVNKLIFRMTNVKEGKGQGTHSNCVFKFPVFSLSDRKFSLCQFT